MNKIKMYEDTTISFYKLPKPESEIEVKAYVKRFDKEFGSDFIIDDYYEPKNEFHLPNETLPSHEDNVMARIEFIEKTYEKFQKASKSNNFKIVSSILWDFPFLEEDKPIDFNEFNVMHRRKKK